MVTPSLLTPLRVNKDTGEPYLRLRNHPKIIITPPRPSDAPIIVSILNDPSVHPWLKGPPYPYLAGHADDWLHTTIESCNVTRHKLEESEGDGIQYIDGCPVRSLREVGEDGTDVFLGDIGFQRCNAMELANGTGVDWIQKSRLEEENQNRPPGDPNIVWSIGDYLAASHHGRGIMTDAVGTLLEEWAMPRMNVHRILVTTFKGNKGSMRVFEKNGFKHTKTVEDHLEVKGELRSLEVLEWEK